MVVFWLILGLVVLSIGAELLIRGASQLAVALGISPLVVGLTVVAFGTSAPELVVSVQATLNNQPDVALGNVVGSNILNVLLVLGLSAAIVPLVVSQQLVRFDTPLMVAISIVMYLFSLDGQLGRGESLVFAASLIAYLVWAVVSSRKEQAAIKAEYEAEFGASVKTRTLAGTVLNLVFVVAGLVMLVSGADWFVESAITIARQLGVSELVIGLTIVAAGTSLPELATSVMAALRGERDIAVGNVIGSNLFNIMGVLGISGLVSQNGIPISPAALQFDLPIMVAVAMACMPVFFVGHRIDRWEGVMFLFYYVAYVAYIVFAASFPNLVQTFETLMLGFVIPLTVITLLISVVRHWRGEKNGHSAGAVAANSPPAEQTPQ